MQRAETGADRALPSGEIWRREHALRLADSGAELASRVPPSGAGEDAGLLGVRVAVGAARGEPTVGPAAPLARAAAPAVPPASPPPPPELGLPTRIGRLQRLAGQVAGHVLGPEAGPSLTRGQSLMGDVLLRSLGLQGLRWKCTQGPVTAWVRLLLTALQELAQRPEPPPEPWEIAILGPERFLAAALARNRLLELGHRQLVLTLADSGSPAAVAGRWRRVEAGRWGHEPWPGQQATCDARPSGRLESLLGGWEMVGDDPGLSAEVRVCQSVRQLAELIAAGHLPGPTAILGPELGPVHEGLPARATVGVGHDAVGPFVLSAPPGREGRLVRQPGVEVAPGALAGGEILRRLVHGGPVSLLAGLGGSTDTGGPLVLAEAPTVGLAELQAACPNSPPTYLVRGRQGLCLSRPELLRLAAEEEQQVLGWVQAADAL